jgi:phosphatidylinositol alpha-1,6-mannosyltransferase
MKLLLATQNFGPAIGGIEQYCGALARALCAEGASVTVLAPPHPDALAHDAAFPCEVVRYSSAPAKEIGLAQALLAQRSRGYDAIVCLQWTSALLPALHSPAPLAIVCHGKEVMPLPKTLRQRAEQLTRSQVLARADHVFAVSNFTAEHAIAAGARAARVRVIHPGVDLAQYAAAAAAKKSNSEHGRGPLLLTVARLVARKGIDTVLTALPEIAARHPNVRYAIAGEGLDRDRLEALIRQLALTERVEWLGYVNHDALAPLYASADLFVLPSRSISELGDIEGFGLVLLEAQACGTPVVAARSGGMPDALEDGVTGVLVPPSDPAALAHAIDELLSDEPKRARMSQAARALAATRTWQATARAFLAALDR